MQHYPEYGAAQWDPPPYMYPPPRKPVWPWVVSGIAIVVAIAAAVGIVVVVTNKDDKPAAATSFTVSYEITGDTTTPLDITYDPSEGDAVKVTITSLPWQMQTTVTKLPHDGYVQVYTGTEYSGTGVTCRMLRDGKVLEQDTVTGSGTASCGRWFN